MTSQPNPHQRSKTPRVILTEHGPRIDAAETLQLLWDAFAVSGAFALADLLTSAADTACFIEPSRNHTGCASPLLAESVLEAIAFGHALRLPSLATSQVAATATETGSPTGLHRVWADPISGTFASSPRLIEVLHVEAPWRYTRVSPPPGGSGGIVASGDVTPGNYLVCSTGVGVPAVQAVCRIERIPASADLEALDGFRTDRMTAVCGKCRRGWIAEHGQGDFAPLDPEGKAWRIDQATDFGFVTGTVACPAAGCAGRVGFTAEGGRA